ncbi:MAG: hypothetical protein ACHQZQ_03370 [SAR324 cluster bacterium]
MNARQFRPVLALLVTLGALCACGSGLTKDKLTGAIGPGAGGPPVGTMTSSNIDRPDGTLIGTFSYDGGFFLLAVPDPTEIGVLIYPYPGSGPPQIQIAMTHISGRSDTPCRFFAATEARDSGFVIGDTGFRTNAQDQQLYQVNLQSPGAYATLFCANLSDNTGAQFSVAADAPDKVSWLQVYAVINSIHAQ